MHDLTWLHTSLYCLKCGKQTVIKMPQIYEDNAGIQNICFSCGFGFFHPEDNKGYCDLTPIELIHVCEQAQNDYFKR